MSTVNGVGTIRYGWKWRSDNTAEATTWLVIGFFPVVPVRRSRVRVLATGESRGGFSQVVGPAFNSRIEEIEKLTLDWGSIAITYLKGYLLVPFLLLLPFLIVFSGMFLLDRFVEREQRNQLINGLKAIPFINAIAIAAGLGLMVYWGVVVSKILDRASGRRVPANRSRYPDSLATP